VAISLRTALVVVGSIRVRKVWLELIA